MAPNNQVFANNPDDFERYKFVREHMREEVTFRREQQWKVFSWISSLLLAVIGGLVALTSNNLILGMPHKITLSLAVIIFALFGIAWIRHEQSVSHFYSNTYHNLDQIFNLRFESTNSKKWHLSYMGFLLLISLLTIAVIWFG